MAILIEIKCITKTDKTHSHERIQSVGGIHHGGTRWQISQSDAILGVEKMHYEFYVVKAKEMIAVVVATNESGHKYLKTEIDGLSPDMLLNLPECP